MCGVGQGEKLWIIKSPGGPTAMLKSRVVEHPISQVGARRAENRDRSSSCREHACDSAVILMRPKALCWQSAWIFYCGPLSISLPPNQPLSPHGMRKG